MTQNIPKEYWAELGKQKDELVKAVYGGGHNITLDTGRVITMKSLGQGLIYGGMLEGVPRSVDMFDFNPWIDDDTYLLYAPVKKWDLYEKMSAVTRVSNYDLENPPLTLPGIHCSAKFASGPVEREGIEENDFSYLNIVWYQNEWAMPISPAAMLHLKAFDWDNHARIRSV